MLNTSHVIHPLIDSEISFSHSDFIVGILSTLTTALASRLFQVHFFTLNFSDLENLLG